MELRQLQYFVKIYECRSFTSAATELGVSQSALSLSMKNLENNLNAIVFIRGANGIDLTKVGENLLGYAIAILQQHAKALANISAIQSVESTTIEIGVNSAFPRLFLDDVLNIFYQRVPSVTVKMSFSAHPLEDVVKNLQRNIWDVAISLDPDGFVELSGGNIVCEDIANSNSQIYARPEHSIHTLESISMSDLKKFNWAISTTVPSLKMFHELFEPHSLSEPNVALYADSFDFIMGAVSSLDLLCFAPDKLVEASNLPLLMVRQSIVAPVQSNWKLMVGGDLQQTKATRIFVKCVRRVFHKKAY